MAQKDITEKVLFEYNEIFSDIINVLLFNGKERINPEALQNGSNITQYKAYDGIVHEQERDISKYWTYNNVRIALFGIENQSVPLKDMILRTIAYDGASYRSQLLSNERRRYPVITIVLYFGEKHWKGPKTLGELLEIPDCLKEFFNDYKLNIFEIAWLPAKTVSKFKSDFGIVADFFVKKRKNKNYIPSDKRVIKHVDEVLKLLSVMTGDKRYESILIPAPEGKETIRTMCDVADRLFLSGKAEGLNEGLSQGKKLGRKEGLKAGRAQGLKAGRAQGLKAGKEEGLKAGEAERQKLEEENARLRAELAKIASS